MTEGALERPLRLQWEIKEEADFSGYVVTCLIEILCQWSLTQVDFDAPLGYKEPERQAQHEESTVSCHLFYSLLYLFLDLPSPPNPAQRTTKLSVF